MDQSSPQNPNNEPSCENEEEQELFISQLPKTKGWLGSSGLSLYQDFWCPSKIISNIISFQNHFKSRDDDIIVASKPKSGTTWLKAILFSIVNRDKYTSSNTPLLISNPHELIPFFEFTLYSKNNESVANLLSNDIPNLRLFSTHIPYASLKQCVEASKCKIVYICRNPLDTIVSHWHFASQANSDLQNPSKWSLEEFVEVYCEGEEIFGPFWSHILGYWNQSIETPESVLVLKYEDLKRDTKAHVKRIASFVGFPFTLEEEKKNVVEKIVELCSLSHLKDLDVNKNGKFMPYFDNKSYFRKGEVGDWVNHLSPSMVERVNKLIHEKLGSSGLTFST